MNPTIKLFREKFPVTEVDDENQNYSTIIVADPEKLEQFLLSEIQKAREEGMKDGEGTKNGVQRYQISKMKTL